VGLPPPAPIRPQAREVEGGLQLEGEDVLAPGEVEGGSEASLGVAGPRIRRCQEHAPSESVQVGIAPALAGRVAHRQRLLERRVRLLDPTGPRQDVGEQRQVVRLPQARPGRLDVREALPEPGKALAHVPGRCLSPSTNNGRPGQVVGEVVSRAQVERLLRQTLGSAPIVSELPEHGAVAEGDDEAERVGIAPGQGSRLIAERRRLVDEAEMPECVAAVRAGEHPDVGPDQRSQWPSPRHVFEPQRLL
jgi:hypothetical protein